MSYLLALVSSSIPTQDSESEELVTPKLLPAEQEELDMEESLRVSECS